LKYIYKINFSKGIQKGAKASRAEVVGRHRVPRACFSSAWRSTSWGSYW